MKINEIERSQVYIDNKRDILPILSSQCADFIKIIKEANGLLYRGMEMGDLESFIGKTPEQRKPYMSTQRFQQMVDTNLKERGFTAIRSNSIFTTGDLNMARRYCSSPEGVYIIFPINGFSFTWSTEIRDLYIQQSLFFNRFLKKMDYDPADIAGNDEYNKMLGQAFKADVLGTYTNENLADGIKSGNEIMLTGEYYAFSSPVFDNFFKESFL